MAKNILVVDDDNEIRNSLQVLFSLHNYNIFTAENGLTALNILKEEEIDLAIVDVQMPVMNGMELLKKIKDEFTLPVILVSGVATEITCKSAYEFGAIAFLEKPLSSTLLIELVKSVLQDIDKIKENKISILIVDDHKETRETLSSFLNIQGYITDTAEDGEIAVNKVGTRFFNIVLMDIKMPKLDGVEAAKKVKKISPLSYIVMMTGEAEENQMKEALSIEDIHYTILRKPFNTASVLTAIKEVARESKLHKEKVEAILSEGKVIFYFRKLASFLKKRTSKEWAFIIIAGITISLIIINFILPLSNYILSGTKSTKSWMQKIEGYLQRDEERELENKGF